MSNLDKEYNKRFQNKKISNADDFDVEGLWDNIENELESDSGGSAFFSFKRVAGVLLLLLLVGGTCYWFGFYNNKKTSSDSALLKKDVSESSIDYSKTNTENTANINKQQKTSRLDKIVTVDQTNQNETSEVIEKEVVTNNEKTNLDTNNSSSAISIQKKITPTVSTIKKELAKVNTQAEQIQNFNTDSNRNNTATSFELNQSFDWNTDAEAETQNKKNIQASILPIKQKSTILESAKPLFPNFEIPKNKETKEKTTTRDPNNIAFTFGVNAGINWNHHNYENADNIPFQDLKNETESGDFGQSYGLDVGLVFKNRWIIKSGLEFHQYWTIFEHTDIQTGQTLKENQLLKVWLDGEDILNSEYGNALVNVTTTRMIIHHNQFRQISIPLEVGFQKRNNKLTYGVTLGGVLNLITKQSGKRLDEYSGIIEYENEFGGKPLNKFKIGMRLSPFIGYHITEKMMVRFNPTWNLQKHKILRPNTYISSKSIQQVNLNLGLNYRF